MIFNTDLALERMDMYRKANNIENEIPGIDASQSSDGDNIRITKVTIKDAQGEQALGKPKGTYITMDIKNLKIANEEEIERAAINLNRELSSIISQHINREEDILVVRLGKQASYTRFASDLKLCKT